MTVTEEWLTTTEVVREFKVSDRTVRRAVGRGDLCPARTSSASNSKMRFRRSDIETWLGVAVVHDR